VLISGCSRLLEERGRVAAASFSLRQKGPLFIPSYPFPHKSRRFLMGGLSFAILSRQALPLDAGCFSNGCGADSSTWRFFS